MVLQVKALLDMARAVPRPKLNGSSRPKNLPPRHQQGRIEESSAYRPVTTSSHTKSSPNSPLAPETLDYRFDPPAMKRTARDLRSSSIAKPFDERDADMEQGSSLQKQEDSIFRINNATPSVRSRSAPSSPDRSFSTSPPHRSAPSSPANRPSASPPIKRPTSTRLPAREVSISRDEEDDNRDVASNTGAIGTRIFLSPHLVPTSPPRARDVSQDAVTNASIETFTVDASSEILDSSGGVQKSYSYDAEENCLISETGVDSEHGKVHYPLSWNRAGLENNRSGSPNRDIMVTRPFRRHGSTGSRGTVPTLASSVSTNSSERWGSETVNFSTGNKDRDELMSRAKAILQAHGTGEARADYSPPERHAIATTTKANDSESDEGATTSSPRLKQSSIMDPELLEDGVAPLGGDWPRSSTGRGGKLTMQQLLADPMNHLHDIHDEAARKLQVCMEQLS